MSVWIKSTNVHKVFTTILIVQIDQTKGMFLL